MHVFLSVANAEIDYFLLFYIIDIISLAFLFAVSVSLRALTRFTLCYVAIYNMYNYPFAGE